MKLFRASFPAVIFRFYLMMACVIGGFSMGEYWVVALAFPIMMSSILGVRFESRNRESTVGTRDETTPIFKHMGPDGQSKEAA